MGLGEPYAVARVMDFVRAGEPGMQVRVNPFLRIRDLSHRTHGDSRLLVATMHADLYPISAVRGKCRVMHRDLIGDGGTPDLATWKRRDDHFYYHQLYDRYIHNFYDVVPTWKVKNAPEEVLDVLRERYSFIVAETTISADLCDALRGCNVCRQWASTAESVRCATCRKFFHMRCLNPPLASKPAKGYSWTCAPCAKQHDAAVEKHGVGGGGLFASEEPTVLGPRNQGQQRRPNRSRLLRDIPQSTAPLTMLSTTDREGLRSFQGWPYRYFGIHTSALDVLDSNDLIYPRAITRVGAKYQVHVPPWGNELEQGLPDHVQNTTKSRGRRRSGSKRKHDEEEEECFERGGDDTVTPICLPPPNGDWEMGTCFQEQINTVENYLAHVTAPHSRIQRYSHIFLDRALTLLHSFNFNTERASAEMEKSMDADFGYFELTPEETVQLDKSMREHANEMHQLKVALPNRPYYEIVQSVYKWKMQELGKLWRSGDPQNLNTLSTATNEQRESSPAESLFSSEELIALPPAKLCCAFCGTFTCPYWYRGFLNWASRMLCVYCGQHWRKYGAETATAFISDAKRSAAYENGSEEPGLGVILPQNVTEAAVGATYTKNVKEETFAHGMTTPTGMAATFPLEQSRCVMCRRLDPRKKLKNCAQCGLSAHQGCIGFTDEALEAPTWLCDLCQNDRDPEAMLLPHCVLCGEAHRLTRRPDRSAREVLTALDVYKPTECNNWVHLLCSLWTPHVQYTDTKTLKLVEGVGSLPLSRYEARCSICNEVRGACVFCAEPTCRTQFHVSCAYQSHSSNTMAFEIFPVKHRRRDLVHTLTFKGESGHMVPQIWCKDHMRAATAQKTYEFFETDTNLGLTALQAFAATHKQVGSTSNRHTAVIESSHALLRRAKHLDAILQNGKCAGAHVHNGSLVPMTNKLVSTVDETISLQNTGTNIPMHACVRCHSNWSPLWWPLPDSKNVCCNICRSDVLGPMEV